MKGQAFVTFASENSADKALKETNGFVLNSKPMAVVCVKVYCRKSALKFIFMKYIVKSISAYEVWVSICSVLIYTLYTGVLI